MRAALYSFSLSLSMRERNTIDILGEYEVIEEGSFFLKEISEEDIASLKQAARNFYQKNWENSEHEEKLFEAMLAICEQGWRFAKEESLRTREQLQSIAVILRSNPTLTEAALRVAQQDKPNVKIINPENSSNPTGDREDCYKAGLPTTGHAT